MTYPRIMKQWVVLELLYKIGAMNPPAAILIRKFTLRGQSRFSIGPGNWSGENFVGSSKKQIIFLPVRKNEKKDKISSLIKCSASFYDSPTVLITCSAVLAVPHIDAIILFSLRLSK